jgi:hypothetical protein
MTALTKTAAIRKPRAPGRIASSRLTDAVCNYLNYAGHFVYRSNNMGRQLPNGRWINPKGKRGIPDISGCAKNGKALYVEIKIGRDKLTPEQQMFQNEVRRRGGYCLEIRSVDEIINWHDGIALNTTGN